LSALTVRSDISRKPALSDMSDSAGGFWTNYKNPSRNGCPRWQSAGSESRTRSRRKRACVAGEATGSIRRRGLLVTSAVDDVEATPGQWAPPGSSSLAYTDQMVTAEPVQSCPKARGRVVVELHTGQVFPDRCRSNQCLFCLPLNARRRTLAITLAGPQRMIRLSLVAGESDANPCRTALIRIKRIRQALSRMGLDAGEWTYTIEKNPKGTGYHAHCLQRGSYIPQDHLQEACERARAGIPYINKIKREGVWTSRYGLKGFGADGYGLKGYRPSGDPGEALRINNRRLEHHTTGFYAIDQDVLKVRDMERAAIATMNANQPMQFVNTDRLNVHDVLGNADVRHKLILDGNQRKVAQLRAFR
jgi:hypothetical protein